MADNVVTPEQVEDVLRDAARRNKREFWRRPYPVDRAVEADTARVTRGILAFDNEAELLEYEEAHGCQVGIWLERTGYAFDEADS